MKQILSIQSSITGNNSMSRKLSEEIIEHLKRNHSDAQVIERDLSISPVPHLVPAHFNALQAPEAERSNEQQLSVAFADELINELLAADFVIIGVPFYNFSIPSTLKSWLDHIAVAGKTFSYSATGPEGLVKNKKAFLAIAQGGIYSKEPMKALDHTEPYLRGFLGFLGITDITVFRAEGLKIPGLGEQNLQYTIKSIGDFSYQ